MREIFNGRLFLARVTLFERSCRRGGLSMGGNFSRGSTENQTDDLHTKSKKSPRRSTPSKKSPRRSTLKPKRDGSYSMKV